MPVIDKNRAKNFTQRQLLDCMPEGTRLTQGMFLTVCAVLVALAEWPTTSMTMRDAQGLIDHHIKLVGQFASDKEVWGEAQAADPWSAPAMLELPVTRVMGHLHRLVPAHYSRVLRNVIDECLPENVS